MHGNSIIQLKELTGRSSGVRKRFMAQETVPSSAFDMIPKH